MPTQTFEGRSFRDALLIMRIYNILYMLPGLRAIYKTSKYKRERILTFYRNRFTTLNCEHFEYAKIRLIAHNIN